MSANERPVVDTHHGVRVNAVLPGNILTESRAGFVASRADGKEIDAWADANQLFGRSGTIEETGRVCLFPATDAASFLTGIEVFVTAGAELSFGTKYPPRFLK